MRTFTCLFIPLFLVSWSASATDAPCTVTCSQGEYADAAMPKWEKVRNDVEKQWNFLLQQAGREPNPASLKDLQAAKLSWENYRESFCESVSRTYGGAWASAHSSDCRTQVGEAFLKSSSGYGW
jgi:hypothetical protein